MAGESWTDPAEPYRKVVAKTAGDAAFGETRGFRVSVAGTLTVIDASGASVAFAAIEAGWHPLAITRFVSGTATGLFACY